MATASEDEKNVDTAPAELLEDASEEEVFASPEKVQKLRRSMSGFVGHLHKQYKLAYDIMSLDGDNQFKVKQKDLDVGDAFLKFCTAYDLYAKVLVIPTAQKLAHDLYQTELTAKKEFDDDVNIYLQKFVVKDEVDSEQMEIQKLREEFEVSFRLIKKKYSRLTGKNTPILMLRKVRAVLLQGKLKVLINYFLPLHLPPAMRTMGLLPSPHLTLLVLILTNPVWNFCCIINNKHFLTWQIR